LTTISFPQAEQAFHGRGFSGPVWAEKAKDLTLVYGEAYPIDSDGFAILLPEVEYLHCFLIIHCILSLSWGGEGVSSKTSSPDLYTISLAFRR
jgi:hypothetical protein